MNLPILTEIAGSLDCEHQHTKWGFPKIRGAILGIPVIRTIVPSFWEITI